jgi:hypothetical protein
MCCFTGPVLSVTSTRIFARDAGDKRQYLAYAMDLNTAKEVAMVLPLPVPAKSPEDAVKFIDLSGYPTMFTDLFTMMDFPVPTGKSRGLPAPAAAPIAVQSVGAFDASFVPSITDFARLDERFRLPAGTWDKLPAYRDYGFAVFKLKAGEQHFHPMAFSFPRRDDTSLFFPTVHIHDGTVTEKANFDHYLYTQLGKQLGATGWKESPGLAKDKVDIKRAMELVAGDQHVYCQFLRGKLANQDTWLKLG